MSEVSKAHTVSVYVQRTPKEVYEFASNPENLPAWATAFCKDIRKSGDDWLMTTPAGQMKVRFAMPNELGVLDHFVSFTSSASGGSEIYVPMRVVANGTGSEVLFTLFHFPGIADEQFALDMRMVQSDLHTLRTVLERSA